MHLALEGSGRRQAHLPRSLLLLLFLIYLQYKFTTFGEHCLLCEGHHVCDRAV